jgi:hypothetical protein
MTDRSGMSDRTTCITFRRSASSLARLALDASVDRIAQRPRRRITASRYYRLMLAGFLRFPLAGNGVGDTRRGGSCAHVLRMCLANRSLTIEIQRAQNNFSAIFLIACSTSSSTRISRSWVPAIREHRREPVSSALFVSESPGLSGAGWSPVPCATASRDCVRRTAR